MMHKAIGIGMTSAAAGSHGSAPVKKPAIDALTSGIVATNAMFRSAAAGQAVVSAASIESRATHLATPHVVPR